ncbi:MULTISPECIES: cytochrome c biogenesis CcdA family protein [Mycolicibacterium]|uniref:Cytochrome c biogenesis protein, transmembrane region n=1 Tax=Mycolicibacterium vanbaalenii (strain DSM 7251 / JCM 13017 / BCRC 16820 / KCTC 9966 / NRRL B-24157 / PYR-1) TaxID=350058 RepID=A1TGM2_MYCVP|nr:MULTISPECIES: cytochrome c biogenesis CcdA family protein [Mycolicibacterium]ABM16322.1 cytochrome c biogenesis protein, transmembrane region [Mycolicibacterium vanbaalenii PYR-1]MCV7127653.1 cytochrome c biogenesis protein CcdA [Mycolicibacterium vanbaalenii PYR-1]PQP50875.1 cytochrome c biogenesis protein CcdA [Mycolicibacterium austroafricanum]QZY45818.1 cytochrome c biogenesis CcdA family protein [Mycolicibacterium austroafricanum]UJL30488.1 cytochrome c biogenesis protein CcdA [Mycolic
MTGVGIFGAFLGGLASLLSPCSALLLPSFFAYAFDRVQRLVQRTTAFWVGLCVVLVPLGAGVSALGGALTRYRGEVTMIGGVVIIGMGLMTVLGRGFALSSAQRLFARIRISTTMSVIALGALYGLAGFCAGPLLGGVLTVSAMGGDPVLGGTLMAVYALGMAAPLFVLALLWKRFDLSRRGWLRGKSVKWGPVHTHSTSLVSGVILVVIGTVFLVTDGTANLGGVLGVDEQFDLQVWLRVMGTSAADPIVLLGVVGASLAWRGHRLWRRRSESDESVTVSGGGGS